MADANANRPVDEKELLSTALKENMAAEGIKKVPSAETKVSQKTRMKEPKQVVRSLRTGNIIITR